MDKVHKKLGSLLAAILFFSNTMFAQQNHFIYVQTENKQPFYIKLDKKILSSSASGYLIIPRLQEGTYVLSIGFPKNEWPEQNVTCTVNKKDAGYLLKDFGEKGWGLFNLQTMEVVMSGTKPASKTTTAGETQTDVFSNTLSNVVNDPSIIKKTEEKPAIKDSVKLITAPPQKEIVTEKNATVINDSIAVAKKEDKPVSKEESKTAVIKEDLPKIPSTQITKLLDTKTDEGTEIVYVDIVNGSADTITMFIPAEKINTIPPQERAANNPATEQLKKEEPPKPEEKKEEIQKEETKKTEPAIKPEQKNNDPKFIDIELPNPNAKKDSTTLLSKPARVDNAIKDTAQQIQVSEQPKEPVVKQVIGNSDCKAFSTEDDFLKLRKKMAAENNDDDMVNVAKKVFRTRCFTTEQIKNLSVLFLKDEGKYKFFDAAYPFVSDSYNFSQLENQLSDNYFITRFKAMIRH